MTSFGFLPNWDKKLPSTRAIPCSSQIKNPAWTTSFRFLSHISLERTYIAVLQILT